MVNTNKGLLEKAAIAFPMFKPTVRQTINPGPAVAAIPSISFKVVLLFLMLFL